MTIKDNISIDNYKPLLKKDTQNKKKPSMGILVSGISGILDTIHTTSTNSTIDTKDTINNIDIYSIITSNRDIVLNVIYDNPNITIKEIEEKTNILSSTIKNVIHRVDRDGSLLDIGLIKKSEEQPDKYSVTEQGKKYIEQIKQNKLDNDKKQREQQQHQDQLIKEMQNLTEYINERYEHKILQKKKKGAKHISFDFEELAKWNPILADDILDHPEETLRKLEIAVENSLNKNIKVRIKNLPKSQRIKIGNIRVENLNKMYAIEGIIKQRGGVKPMVTLIKYECPNCGAVVPVLQTGNSIVDPKSCACGRKGKLTELSKEMVDLQVLKLEELPEQLDGRTDCQSIVILLKNDLTNVELQPFYNPGSRIRINGVIYEKPVHKNREKDVVMTLLVEANYIEPQEKKMISTVLKEDLVEIEKISKDKNLINNLCESFVPDIVGVNEQKLGLLLGIVGGGNAKRNRIHILFAGEPGLAKSELLKNVPRLFKNARYANGASSSSVGLTASVIKDEFTGSWGLQAGAVVMANDGVACIDELDKMKDEEKNDLNECMEQGTVTINKAGISGTLQAKTSLFMACNPKNHTFSEHTNYIEQLNLPFALISRFDLIYILKNSTKEMLKKLSLINEIDYDNLCPPICEDLFVKYILLAREKTPLLPRSLLPLIMEKLYLLADYKDSGESSIPFGARQLEALRRLSTAFAKLKLKDEVTVEDLEDAWNILIYSLKLSVPNTSERIYEEKVFLKCCLCESKENVYQGNDGKPYCKNCLDSKKANRKHYK